MLYSNFNLEMLEIKLPLLKNIALFIIIPLLIIKSFFGVNLIDLLMKQYIKIITYFDKFIFVTYIEIIIGSVILVLNLLFGSLRLYNSLKINNNI